MATFSYSGTHALPNGIFICSTSATSGGAQSNPVLLQYRGQRTVVPYRDAVVFQALGRSKAATEIGQYNFLSVQFSYAIPPSGADWDGSVIDGATVEGRILAITNALQTGSFVEYFDSRGRHLIGTWLSDPQIQDEFPFFRTVTATICEVGP